MAIGQWLIGRWLIGPWSLVLGHWSFLLGALLVAPLASAQQATEWLTGAAIDRRLAEPIDIQWQDNATLRDSLGRLSRACRVAIVLDRRIDPSRTVEIKYTDTPLGTVLDGIAREFNRVHAQADSFPRQAPAIELSQLGSVIYIGPQAAARGLRTLAEVRRDDLRKLSAAQAERLARRGSLRWPDLTTPRQALNDLASEAGIEVLDVEEHVPHDLWPAGDWPALSVLERLTLLAVQFDLTFRIEGGGKQVRLVKIAPEDTRLLRTHNVTRNAAQVAEAWRKACPDAEIRLSGNQITVRGRLEDHEWFTSPTKAKTTSASTGGVSLYTFTVTNQRVDIVIRTIAERLNLTLKMDEEAIAAAGIDLSQRVTFMLKEVPMRTLIEKALPKGLKYRLEGNVLQVMPAK